MNIQGLSMDRSEARKAWLAYARLAKAKRANGERADEEDRILLSAYREIARGNGVIHLPTVIRDGGAFGNGMPRLAIARADRRQIVCRVTLEGAVSYAIDMRQHYLLDRIDLPARTLPRPKQYRRGMAIVPSVPAHLRPKDSLSNYFVLWEAEEWMKVPIPPRDPALLKALGAGFFAVLAVWDLSDLERLVLGMTRANLPR